MPRPRKSVSPLYFLPVYDRETGDVTVVVETPKGSRNKYKYDPSCGALRLSAVLGEGLAFPHDFGFVPSTPGADGDPLDILLFLDHGVPPGSIATARLIGVLEIRQRAAKSANAKEARAKKAKATPAWTRNDRFIAAATHAHDHQDLHTLDDLRPHLLDELEAFFVSYAGLEGKTLEVLGRKGPRRAHKLLKTGAKLFRSKVGAKGGE